MIATVLTLLLMALVVRIFAMVGGATAQTRSMLELNERLRNCKITLQADLANITTPMLPPLRVEDQAGYFEYIEGPMGPLPTFATAAIDSEQGVADSTVGDIDDVLMFTTRNDSQPFYGRVRLAQSVGAGTQWVDTTTTSPYAEVCYFVRGNTLYRRMLLINGALSMSAANAAGSGYIDPAALTSPNGPFKYSFYDKFDISVHQEGGTYDTTGGTQPVPMLKANTLGDLTRRENRYGHQPHAFPFDTRFWGALGLPTLRECTFYTDIFNTTAAGTTARWPYPFFDPVASPNLWGAQVGTPGTPTFPTGPYAYCFGPYIYPNGPAAYQNYYQNANIPAMGYTNANLLSAGATPNTIGAAAPGTFPQFLNLTQNGAFVSAIDSWLLPTYPWDQVSPFNGAIAAFSLSADEQDPVSPGIQYNASTRVSDDVILTNVISFDVKAWDPEAPILFGTIANPGAPAGHSATNYYDASPATVYMPGDGVNIVAINGTNYRVAGANYLAALQSLGATTAIVGRGAYVDLGYQQLVQFPPFPPPVLVPPATTEFLVNALLAAPSVFSSPGSSYSPLKYVYDTGCFNYEEDGIDNNNNGIIDDYTNGFDDNGIGGIDDITELEAPVPYTSPLKGIQVKIRVVEPDSRQIREITVVEDFLWE